MDVAEMVPILAQCPLMEQVEQEPTSVVGVKRVFYSIRELF